MLKHVIKRDGSTEPFTPHKLNKWGQWASEHLGQRVDWSSVVLDAVRSTPESLSSQDLQQRLINSCLTKKDWPHNLMAGRLYIVKLYKEMYGDNSSLPSVKELHDKLYDLGLMRKLSYTDAEYDVVNCFIDHSRDLGYAHYQIHHIVSKYSIQDRSSRDKQKLRYETPQFVFMRMAMALAEDEPQASRLQAIKSWYDSFSKSKVNAPTPNYVNLGTPHAGYASCCLYTVEDSARSLAIGDHIAYTMTYMSAGIGAHLNVRSLNDSVRGGLMEHQGKLPYFKALAGAVKANLQAGRGGACTAYYSCFDPEAEVIAVLQNPRTPRDRQNRDIHFCVQFNKLFAKKVARGEDIFTFNIKSHPKLMELFFSGDNDVFENEYERVGQEERDTLNWVNARARFLLMAQQSYDVGTHYYMFIDEANRHTPFKETIYLSNLCVAPETLILTDQGHQQISTLQDQVVSVWNGEEWSEVIVRKTSDSAKLITVVTDSGYELTCTPEHKFYVQNKYSKASITEVRAADLKNGDKLIKLHLPVIQGDKELDLAYVNGFFSGDGCYVAGQSCPQRVYLYGEKRKLVNQFPEGTKWHIQEDQDRMLAHFDCLEDKFFVPDATYTVKSRLDWLAGYADADGSIYRNVDNQQLVVTSVCKEFLVEVVLMLQTLGIFSKMRNFAEEGLRLLPANDGTGSCKEFMCQRSYRLIIPSAELQKLLKLGLKLHRLSVVEHKPNRSATKFVKVSEVIDTGRVDETFCFTEPKRHMGVFNGILTGQCSEIVEPTKPYKYMVDLYSENHENGEVALCNLAAINVAAIESDAEYAEAMYNALKMIDKTIHQAHYQLPHVGYTAKQRMNAGVGIIGLAYYLAKRGLTYTSVEGLREIHRVAERHLYHAISASLRLGRELGNAAWMHKTKWPEGWLPIDTYKKTVDEIVEPVYFYDWEKLRAEVVANGGIRNSCLIAHMPTESSSKASSVPNGVYPIRDLSLKKTDRSTVISWCAPNSDLLGDAYQIAWDIPSIDLIKVYAVLQKFCDQTISADLYQDRRGSKVEVTTEQMITEFLAMVKYGMKSRYYQNSLVAAENNSVTEMAKAPVCVDGACML